MEFGAGGVKIILGSKRRSLLFWSELRSTYLVGYFKFFQAMLKILTTFKNIYYCIISLYSSFKMVIEAFVSKKISMKTS